MENPEIVSQRVEIIKKSPKKKLSLGQLHNKTFFLNLSRPRNIVDELQKGIKALGGRLEEFFSQDINCVLTDEKVDRSKEDSAKEPASKTIPTIGSASVGSLCFRKLVVLPKKATTKKNTLLEKAREWNIKIQNIDHFLIWMRNALQSKGTISRYKNTTNKSKPNAELVFPLKTHFLKLEGIDKQHKPLYKSFQRFPSIKYKSGYVKSPFDDSSEPSSLASNDPKLFDSTSPKRLPAPKAVESNPEVQKPVAKRRASERRQYCECCNTYFTSLSKHVKGPRHEEFLSNTSNFDCVFDVLNQIKTAERPSKLQNKMKKRSAFTGNQGLQASEQPKKSCTSTIVCDENVPPDSFLITPNDKPQLKENIFNAHEVVSCNIEKQKRILPKHISLLVTEPELKKEFQKMPLELDHQTPCTQTNNQLANVPTLNEIQDSKDSVLNLSVCGPLLHNSSQSSAQVRDQCVTKPADFSSFFAMNEPDISSNSTQGRIPCDPVHSKPTEYQDPITLVNATTENQPVTGNFSTLFPINEPEIFSNSTLPHNLASKSESNDSQKAHTFTFPSLIPKNVEPQYSHSRKSSTGYQLESSKSSTGYRLNTPPPQNITTNIRIGDLHESIPINMSLMASSFNSIPFGDMFDDSLTHNTLFSSECSEDQAYNENICGVVEAIINSENCRLENGGNLTSKSLFNEVPSAPCLLSVNLPHDASSSIEDLSTEPYCYDEDYCKQQQVLHETNSDIPSCTSYVKHGVQAGDSCGANISSTPTTHITRNPTEFRDLKCIGNPKQWTVKQHGETKLVFFRNSSASTEAYYSENSASHP